MPDPHDNQRLLVRYLYLSIAAALATIGLKSLAAGLTGSVGFLSDALESVVNLVAAIVGLIALRIAARPPDDVHPFGHGQVEYMSAAVEGGMIFVAAAAIVYTAVQRLIEPVDLEQAGIGLVLSTMASLINLGVGWQLLRVGKRHRSMVLVADGKHLLTDVVTSAGVLIGIALVTVTGWRWLDPVVALVVGVNILVAGYLLIRRSVIGLLNASLPDEDLAEVEAILTRYRAEHQIDFHALRSRESGRQRFVYVHLLTPAQWTVKRGHDLTESLAKDIRAVLPGTRTFVHIEPIGDPASYDHPHIPAI
ncbi:MAG TPA: cation diffusion facilitator family transporter [Ilumatobacteraceae bacterium]|nr:cation diffusion facilitator family transporter [Ilumatobacteraceae bacterium]